MIEAAIDYGVVLTPPDIAAHEREKIEGAVASVPDSEKRCNAAPIE
jgi:hypothetical protein